MRDIYIPVAQMRRKIRWRRVWRAAMDGLGLSVAITAFLAALVLAWPQ